MPHATTDDGVRLYYEETGSGRPVIFVHEYAGDYRSWSRSEHIPDTVAQIEKELTGKKESPPAPTP